MKYVIRSLLFALLIGHVTSNCSSKNFRGDGSFSYNYGTSGTCTYKFKNDDNDVMKIQWGTSFDVQGYMPSCTDKDYVKVYIG